MVVATSAVEITSTYPHKVLVSITGMTVGQRIRLHRVVNGVMSPVRGGYFESINTDAVVIADNEAPFGVPVYWRTRVNEQFSSYFDRDSAPLNLTLEGGKVCVSDAITGNSAEVTVMAWDKTSYSADATVFRVAGQNKVITGPGGLTGQFTADVRLRVNSTSSKENLLNLLASATSGTLQIRRSVSNGTLDECYFSVLNFDIERVSNRISDERRDFVMSIVEKDSWPYTFVAQGFTYGDLEAVYSGLTYADLELDFPTYLDLMQADLGS